MRKSVTKSRDVCYGPGKFTICRNRDRFLSRIRFNACSIKIYHVHFPDFYSKSYLQLEMEEIDKRNS